MLIGECPESLHLPKVVSISKEIESRISGGDTGREPRIFSAGTLRMPFLQRCFEASWTGVTAPSSVFLQNTFADRTWTQTSWPLGILCPKLALLSSSPLSFSYSLKQFLQKPLQVFREMQGGGTWADVWTSNGVCACSVTKPGIVYYLWNTRSMSPPVTECVGYG